MDPAIVGCPVKVPVAAQDYSAASVGAVHTRNLGAKAVNRSQRPARSDFEHRSFAVGPTRCRCPVKVSVLAQHGPERPDAVTAEGVVHNAKAVNRSQRSRWRELED